MRKGQEWFEQKLSYFKTDLSFRLECIILDLTEQICIAMKKRNINRSNLAQLLGVSPAAVSKILNGTSNFTLRTLVSLAAALGLELKIGFKDKENTEVRTLSHRDIMSDFEEFDLLKISVLGPSTGAAFDSYGNDASLDKAA